MIEQIDLTMELAGAVQDIRVTYRYYGHDDIEIDNVQAGSYHLDTGDLTSRERGTIYSSIRNKKVRKEAV